MARIVKADVAKLGNALGLGPSARKSLSVQIRPSAPHMFHVYILQSLKDLRTYTGYTEDVNKRLIEHNTGKVKATRNRRPFRVLFVEDLATLQEAKKKELYWKSGSGRRKLKIYFRKKFPPRPEGAGEARSNKI